MALFTGDEVLAATGGTLLKGTTDRLVQRVCTDSRKVRKGDLFVALKGTRFDGHRFIDEVFTRGANGVVVETFPRQAKGSMSVRARSVPFVVKVADSLKAYQDLATFHRTRFDIPVVAVTGSNGKTTTKEMVAKALSQCWRLKKTAGNLNNRIGLPQTVLGLTAAHQAAVLELGVDAEGQTTRLAEIARPTVGLITNVGNDHLEFFGSVEGSARAKAELLARLPQDGTVVLNADDPYYEFFRRRTRCAVVSFGFREQADVRGSRVQWKGARTEFCCHVAGRRRSHRLALHVHGTHNVSNALAALAVGHVLGLSVTSMATGLSRFRPVAMRSQVSSWRGVTVIQDYYNANPDSMKAAVTLLQELGAGRRTIAVLGDMLELGTETRTLHKEVGVFLAGSCVSLLVTCGELGREVAHAASAGGMTASQVFEARGVNDAARILKKLVEPGDVVLLKASRSMQFERLVAAFHPRTAQA
ncbi:MAG: UDP-N-acetylmuramoyl-tripeptide--D-alanyl-D-alanine ligase [Nitrospira sp. SB0677_bin_15]|nr:UDP-N-acetylmuramoyl-tripeptide--D-alanyl-D-alanine ligase [Nitrospira sp. SB0661_bin_20]MYG40805.1 UDP-N-acetylmuramoyl-tripeptide--D-alanyl-D-alanine ligase [Nitrospira sp. SB0677_bin_15]MYH02656.1 UDP-N-acetylmuramoyl-tripeptide--D-alanyl-D-alanine ligase [Nitrospira sp. SB0675_bin_23]MYJ22064.1 UDP-N-acetylmuramoyl-tripeptide--D-alanyl-D-alanine ligase [Nitrospira sp. SB0673_bin_12]